MSEFKPTAAQSAAMTTRGSAVLVSAGAGSGKTKVLTERLMGFITDPEHPVDIDSFLVITYTRAAAGELRGRIMDELAAKLANDPSNRRLRRQSALCQRAQIGTIHGFCAALIRENCNLAGISPDFKVIDDERAQTMKTAALERVLEQRYEHSADYPGFIALVDSVGRGRDDHRLAELVLTLHGKMQSHARPEEWARGQVELLNSHADDVGDTPWGREVLDAAKRVADYWVREMDRLILAMDGCEKIREKYLPSISETAAQIRELSRRLDIGWDKARECLPIEFPTLGRLVNSPDPELSTRIKNRRDECKNKAMRSIEKTLSAPSAKLLDEMAATADAMSALLALTLDFDAQYSQAKRRAGFCDYADLEHIAAQLLTNTDGTPTELAARLSARYTEVMVDEYQDVSQVQDTIFKAASDEGNKLFLVGDVKQSIYRFRLADPEIFTEKYTHYPDAELAAEGEPRRILLQENFRSRREILDCANAVFSLCMSRELGELEYDEAARLKCGASYPGSVPVPELLLLDIGAAADEDDDRPDKKALEARLIGTEIQKLMSAGTEVGGRPLEYGDIAILMRAANANRAIYARELAAMGIPVAAGQSSSFFDSVEVSSVISLLAVIDNPHQDIPLIAALRSPAFGFSADKLAFIRTFDTKGDFYAALTAAAEQDADCARFISVLTRFRALAPELPAAELLWQLVDELDLIALCSAMTNGAQRRANLLELIELSGQFDATQYRGVHRFVLWLRQLSESGNEPNTGAVSTSAVQIMTIHKSKGLEFPVVFLSDMSHQFNKMDMRSSVLIHPKLGLGAKVTDMQRRVEYPSLARNAIQLRLERELLSEEMRVMYVALTRPKERLFITAAMKDPEKAIATASAVVTTPMESEVLANAASYVWWFIYAALADEQQHLKIRLCRGVDGADDTAEECVTQPVNEEALAKLESAMRFSYPHKAAQALPSKITATELKSRVDADPEAAPLVKERIRKLQMPDFTRKDKPVTGAERGIATHLALQCMDIGKTASLDEVRGEIARLEREKFLSAREVAAVDANAIYKLFTSPLGQRIRTADKIHREFKFSLLCDAGDVYPDVSGEELLLQGVVDCCIEENGKLCIIDYKTDRVRDSAALSTRVTFYTPQLRAYASALRRIFGMDVASCVLYFLDSGKIAEIAQKDLH